MRYCLLGLLLLMGSPVLAQNSPVGASASVTDKILIRSIDMEGFVLGDKDQFIKMFKPYRNKYMSGADMDALLAQIEVIYEREGYQQLVSITYQVIKHRLVFTALMTS